MGKYIHLFQTQEEYNEAVDNNFTEPWVSYTKENDKVDYYKTEYERKCEQYFTIEATEDGTTVYFRQSSFAVNDGLDPLKVEVSTDNGDTWTEVTAVPDDDVLGAILAELNAGEKVLIRGNNKAYGYFSGSEGNCTENCNFWADSPCYVYGNIMSLIGGNTFARLREVKKYAFAFFFSDYNEELDWSWVLLKKDNELLLPAITLADSCYCYMFSNCTGLTSAPKLPATTLISDCYKYMFSGCTGLTVAPILPATTLVIGCYCGMFFGCTNLSYIKAMFTTTPENSYTRDWVTDVKATGTFVKNSAATWNVTGDNGVPTGWTVETADN